MFFQEEIEDKLNYRWGHNFKTSKTRNGSHLLSTESIQTKLGLKVNLPKGLLDPS